jgi:hypothetical protein
MMKDYIIKKNGEQWDVIETQTDLVVKSCINPCSAQVEKTRLNNGAGFAGWTPSFFVKNYSRTLKKRGFVTK